MGETVPGQRLADRVGQALLQGDGPLAAVGRLGQPAGVKVSEACAAFLESAA
jgi:hypothetical protein